MKIMIGDTIFNGSATDIVKKMQRKAFVPRMKISKYILFCVEEYERLFGINLSSRGGTTKEMAESFVESLCTTGVAKRAN